MELSYCGLRLWESMEHRARSQNPELSFQVSVFRSQLLYSLP